MSKVYVNHESDNTITGWVTSGELTDETVEVQWPGFPVPQTESTSKLIPLLMATETDEVIGARITRRQARRGQRVQVQMFNGTAVHGTVVGWGTSVLQLNADGEHGGWMELRSFEYRDVYELLAPSQPTT